MAPVPLTDTQQRADAAAFQAALQYNQLVNGPGAHTMLADAQRTALIDWARTAYGDGAAKRMQEELDKGVPISPKDLSDEFIRDFPRKDAPTTSGTPAPATPAPGSQAPGGQNGAPAPGTGAESTGDGDDVFKAAPGDGRVWLQGNEKLPTLASEDEAAIKTLDNAVNDVNNQHFKTDPGSAWHTGGAQLPTGTNISTLGGTYAKLVELVPKWMIKADELKVAFDDGASQGKGEYLIAQQRDKITKAISALKGHIEVSKSLAGSVARTGIAANDSFHQMRGEMLNKRQAVSDATKKVKAGKKTTETNPILGTSETKTTYTNKSSGEFAAISAVNPALDKIGVPKTEAAAITKIAGGITAPDKVEREVVGTGAVTNSGTSNKGTPSPVTGSRPTTASPGSPTSPGSPSKTTAPTNTPDKKGTGDDTLSKLLSSLGQGGQQGAQQAAQAPQQAAQAAQQAAQPLANAAQQAAQQAAKTPEELLKALRGAEAGNQKHEGPETPATKAADKDRAAATSATFTPPGAASPAGLGAAGSDARPHQLDANGKPVDKNGDGKVDKDAVPLSKKTVKPFDLSVDANGKNVQVKGVPDPRLGEMILDMADNKDGKPLSVLDAAKAAGMPITSLGDPIDPAEAKVGDAVVGDTESGIYLGDDKVITSTGEVKSLDEVIGEDGFVSEIPLPDLPEDAPAGGDQPGQPGQPAGDGNAPAGQHPAGDQAPKPIEPVTSTSSGGGGDQPGGGAAPQQGGANPPAQPAGQGGTAGGPPNDPLGLGPGGGAGANPTGPQNGGGGSPAGAPAPGNDPGGTPPQGGGAAPASPAGNQQGDGPATMGTGGLTVPDSAAGASQAPAAQAPAAPAPGESGQPAPDKPADPAPAGAGVPTKVTYQGRALG